jgi:hypothetical protein
VEDLEQPGAGVHVRRAAEADEESSRSADGGDQLAEAAARRRPHVEPSRVERDRLRRLEDRRSVLEQRPLCDAGAPERVVNLGASSLAAERVERALSAVRDRELVAVRSRTSEALGQRGRRLTRGQNPLEAARRCERAQARPPRRPAAAAPTSPGPASA